MCKAREGPARPGRLTPFSRCRPGFTLVEIMVVIGIIAILVAITLPTAFSVLSDSRTKQTKATMNLVAAAIEQFGRDNPFVYKQPIIRQITLPGPVVLNYRMRDIFDRYPPSPTAAFAAVGDHDFDHASQAAFVAGGLGLPSPPLGPYPATKEDDADPPTGMSSQDVTLTKFFRLIYLMEGGDFPEPVAPDTCPWITKNERGMQNLKFAHTYPEPYASSECLVFALREFSSGARAILDKLPSGTLTNLDKDFVYRDVSPPGSLPPCQGNGAFDPGWERPIALPEIVDAWKRPMRYAVRENWKTTPTTGATFQWELRSAGEDGVFSVPFTEPDKSDDVILQGP